MLAALYTDSTSYSRMGRLATAMHKAGLDFGRLRALCTRNPAGIPLEKIHSFDRPFYASILGMPEDSLLGSTFIRRGLQGADVVYSMYGEDLAFLEWAKQQDCKIVVDVFVHPDTLRIVEEESLRCTGQSRTSQRMIEGNREHSRKTFALADVLLCPSEWVASGVRSLFPQDAAKICIVPYGSSVKPVKNINTETPPGRILFAGRDALRKGLHVLADAAHRLRSRGHELNVRVAGLSESQVSWMPYAGELDCLGSLPMDMMQQEFYQADVFVLPSLSEGQAGVVLEAMACGCPVVATRESGVDFETGCGVTVPVCDSSALANAICEVIKDRNTGNMLADGALRQSMEYTMEAWKLRLVALMKEVVECA